MFYVYTLTDSRDGAVFYVGKGKGNRLEHHEQEARAGKRSRKCDRIREIWSAGAKVGRNVVERFADEDEAFDREISLIAEIGLANLTNVLPGGQGRAPLDALTPDQIKARYRERRLGPKLEALAGRFSAGAIFPLEPNGKELGAVFTSALRSLVGSEKATGWRQINPQPFTVLGKTFPGPSALEMLLEFASNPALERGNRMDALHHLLPYCRPIKAA